MSEAEEMCPICHQEVDQIHCQNCGERICSLHDKNATIDMLLLRIGELEDALQYKNKAKEEK